MTDLDRLEVLSPAGDMDRLEAALDFGADAVYLGGEAFGMRAAPKNFTADSLKIAVNKAHSIGKKVYLTCNTLPRNNEISQFSSFLEAAVEADVDALIANDIGVFSIIRKQAPDMDIHVSTQSGIVNYVTANEFYNMGAKRVVLARELSFEEIAEIRAKTPKELEIECFVHGAMCVSFSGRCLLSNYLVDRDANRGECAQPCRWGYYLMEEKRPGEYYRLFEDEKGSYILNSKDLCMIKDIDKLAIAGITSFKIEGRAKSDYYVSVITNAYRQAMDIYKADPDNYSLPEWLLEEVYKVSHRDYCTGFYFGHPKDCRQYYESGGYIRNWNVVGIVKGYNEKLQMLECVQRNKFVRGTAVELLPPGGKPVQVTIQELFNENGVSIEDTRHAAMKFMFNCGREFPKNTIIRMQV